MDCQFSFGPNGAYFLKSDSRWAWSDHNLPETLRRVLADPNNPLYCKSPADVAFAMEPGVYSMCWTTKSNQEMYEADYLSPHYTKLAKFIADRSAHTTFGPNRSYFSTTKTGLSWQNLPLELETHIMSRIRIGRPHSIALGVNGAWIGLWDDGQLFFSAAQLKSYYPDLFELTQNEAETKKRKGIAYVAISPFAAGQWFATFGDGSSLFNLPRTMHEDVRTVAASIRPLQSGNGGGGGQSDADAMLIETAKFQMAVQQNIQMQNLFYPRYY